MMPRYDSTHFQPPAALAEVTVKNFVADLIQGEVSLLIDSGADVTVLPRRVADQVGIAIEPNDRCQLAPLAL